MNRTLSFICFSLFLFLAAYPLQGWSGDTKSLVKVVVVDSYHPEYIWSGETHKGMVKALNENGYFDNQSQINDLFANDFVKTSTMHLRQFWMDTKRKTSKKEVRIALS
jgi:hypothetical protein